MNSEDALNEYRKVEICLRYEETCFRMSISFKHMKQLSTCGLTRNKYTSHIF